MGFIVEFETDTSVLRDASTAAADVAVTVENVVFPSEENQRLVLCARGEGLDSFERGLDSDPTVQGYVVLSRLRSCCAYSVTVPDALAAFTPYRLAVDHHVAVLRVELLGDTMRVRVRVPSQDAVRKLRDDYREWNATFDLVRLHRETAETGGRYGLTERQTRALVLAHDRGYYESPRRATLQEIAGELDISRQALSGRLRRGLDSLISATLKRGE